MLLNVETGLNALTEVEALGAFTLLLLLTGKARHDEEEHDYPDGGV